MPRKYPTADLKRLFALSMNQCAAPQCDNPIVVDATPFDEFKVVGQIAHIVASSDRGPRGDPTYPPEELDREPNLLLLCGHHHSVIDVQPDSYTVATLRNWKAEHLARREVGSDEPTRASVATVPLHVPVSPLGFVNREDDLAALDRHTRNSEPGGGSVLLLSGAPGIGKTALSRQWAHGNRERFTDGQLHVDYAAMRSKGGVSVSDALGDLLAGLEVPVDQIPAGLPQRTHLLRTRTVGKRVLIVVDDVENEAEITPLIPAGEDCVLLATVRTELPDLIVDRAQRWPVKRLDEPHAAALLEAMLSENRERVAAEPEAVASLVEFCDGLPIALRICGARLVTNPQRPVSWLVGLLEDERDRLAQLSQVDVVLSEAYASLSEPVRGLYRSLAEHPGRTFSGLLTTAISGESPARAAGLVERLVAAHVLEDEGTQYRFLDPVRLHALDCAKREDSSASRSMTFERIVDFYVGATRAVDHAITPDRLRLMPAPASRESTVMFESDNRAFAWFEAERANVLAVLRAAYAREFDHAVCTICEALWPAFYNRKSYADWIEAYELGSHAARRLQHTGAEARLRSGLAKAFTELSRFDEAERELVTAARMAERFGDLTLRASVTDFRGHLELARHRHGAALDAFETARSLHAEAGVTRGVVLGDFHVGRALAAAGRDLEAVEAYRRAQAGVNPATDSLLLARVLLGLANSSLRLEENDEARQAAEDTLEIARRSELRHYEAQALEIQAELAVVAGDLDHAVELWRRARRLYVELGSPRAEELRVPSLPHGANAQA